MKAGLNPESLGVVLVAVGLAWLGHIYATGRMENASALETVSPAGRTACRVLAVYDGDTIACDLNGDGQVQKPGEEVRFLGVDTPEMHYSRKNRTGGKRDEPFAAEASAWTRKQLGGQRVYLEWDRQRHDPYGRALAHVFLGPGETVSVGEELLKRGLATVLFIEPNHRYQQRYLAVEHAARMRTAGLWGDWAEDNSD